jgi:hypothetical protein
VDPLEANIDTDFGIDTRKGRLHAGLFVGGVSGRACLGCFLAGAKKFRAACNFSSRSDIMVRPAGGTTNMRAFALGLIFSAAAFPCLAQTVLKSEPLILAPYEIAFVQDPSCGAGKVRKVTGAIRGLQRRKACVTLAAEQASLVSATP